MYIKYYANSSMWAKIQYIFDRNIFRQDKKHI